MDGYNVYRLEDYMTGISSDYSNTFNQQIPATALYTQPSPFLNDPRAPSHPVSTPKPAPFGPTYIVAGVPPDLTLITNDGVHLYAHSTRLLHASTNVFGGLLAGTASPDPNSPARTIHVPDASAAITIALHAIYGLSCAHLAPSLGTVEAALDALTRYGVSPRPLAVPSLPLFQLVLAHAPYRPIEAYALAAHHGLEELAVAVSPHLLAYDTSTLSDALSVKMGPVYFRRLFDLHQTRLAALKPIVLKPPLPHPPTAACSAEMQMEMTKVWAFAAAEIVWDALPSISTFTLKGVFEKAGMKLACDDCRAALQTRIHEVMQEWSTVKTTI